MTNNEAAAILWLLLLIPAVLFPFWKIFAKAGYSGWLSILMIVPLVNIVVLYVIAFADRTIAPAQSANVMSSSGNAFCTRCGTALTSGVVFCGACGTRRG